ncbi:MAG: hypothetical protein JXA57_00350 [Armatimonadetes bacterium]|nr:hypothetical protein [Armatimonadota bacterium]
MRGSRFARTFGNTSIPKEHVEVVLWVLRALVRTGVGRQDRMDDALMEMVGLDDEAMDMKPGQIIRAARKRLAELESRRHRRTGALWKNAAMLSRALGFNSTKKELMVFCVVAQSSRVLEETMERYAGMSLSALARALSQILDLPSKEVAAALSKEGALVSSGVLQIDMTKHIAIAVDSRVADVLLLNQPNEKALLESFLTLAQPPELDLDDFPHLSDHTKVLGPYLRQALEDRAKGINVLVYGPPSTGKTQYGRRGVGANPPR